MSTHKHIDRICVAAVIFSVLLTLVFMNGAALGIQAADSVIGYEDRLFDTSRVHTIEIVMDDWDSFIQTCENEQYSLCSVIIDKESYKNVAIRAKGNTSLTSVSSMDSERYSFKIEFDHYDSTKSYHGLDKLSLNNLIQDNTCMKDYLVYQLMGQFGVDAPLCSYVYITVNGEDWGLYLAVEGVEEAFLQRSYGSDYGELYKPDATQLGGGRGNGRNFDMDDFIDPAGGSDTQAQDAAGGREKRFRSDDSFDGAAPDGLSGFDSDAIQPPEGAHLPSAPENTDTGPWQDPQEFGQMDTGGAQASTAPDGDFGPGQMDPGGMGTDDVKLQYINDDPDSYPNIFDNAKTDVSDADQQRLIASLKSLSACEDLESVLDIDEVLRYFVVHNFVVNDDSYTGDMIHNYYLYEEDGTLSMIPWDYNLAFGAFGGGDATSAVNDAIDNVLTDRPMQAWIFSDERYTSMYHSLYAEFLCSANLSQRIDETYELIAPYIEKDPSKFCTYDEFESGVQTLKQFCALRVQSVQGQLNGTIPSTAEAQNEDSSSLISAGELQLSDMGAMTAGGAGGGKQGGSMPDHRDGGMPDNRDGGMPNGMEGSRQAPSPDDAAPDQTAQPQPNGPSG